MTSAHSDEQAVIADDLFAGAGGWDVAGQWLGIHARGVENMTEARLTRDAAGLSTIHDDVWTFEPDGAASGLIGGRDPATIEPCCDDGMTCLVCDPIATFAEYADPSTPPGESGEVS